MLFKNIKKFIIYFKRKINYIFLFCFCFSFFVLSLSFAQSQSETTHGFKAALNKLNVIKDKLGLPVKTQPQDVIAPVIKGLLSLVGIIFFLLIIYAGFLWMTAQDNKDQVKKAKNMLINNLIGLVIIIGAYLLVSFVADLLK